MKPAFFYFPRCTCHFPQGDCLMPQGENRLYSGAQGVPHGTCVFLQREFDFPSGAKPEYTGEMSVPQWGNGFPPVKNLKSHGEKAFPHTFCSKNAKGENG
jgi:hypothetical protein